MFKLFKKRDGAEQAKQLSIYQRRALAYPAPAPGSLPPSAIDAMENDSMVQTALT